MAPLLVTVPPTVLLVMVMPVPMAQRRRSR